MSLLFPFLQGSTDSGGIAVSGTDGIKLGESGTIVVQFIADVRGEALLVSDSASQFVKVPQSGTDGIKLSDSADAHVVLHESGTDGVKLSDSESSTLRIFMSGSDGVILADSSTSNVSSSGTTYEDDGTDGVKLGDSGTSYTVPIQLSIVSGAPNFAIVGNHFVHSIIIELRDAGSHPVLTAGIDITAALDIGATGSLNGTLVVPTDSNGRATFSDLSCTVAQSPKPLIFTASGINGVTDGSNFDVIAVPSDGVKLSDSSSPKLTFFDNSTDGVKLAESASPHLVLHESGTDGIKLSDSASSVVTGGPVTYPEAGTDGLKLSEGGTLVIQFPFPRDEVHLSDSASSVALPAGQTYPKSGTDGIKLSDTADGDVVSGSGNTIAVSATDGIKLGDVGTNQVLEGPTYDGVKVGDAAGLAIQTPLPYEGLKLSDSADSAIADLTQSITDGVKLSEGGTLVQKFNAPTEGMKLSDSASSNIHTGVIPGSGTDSVKLSDSAVPHLVVPVSLEGVVLADDISATFEYLIPDEGLKLSDSASSALGGGLKDTGVDGIKVSESGSNRLIQRRVGTDGVKLSDSASASVAGVYRETCVDGIKLSDVAGVAHTESVVPYEGLKLSDSASAQLGGAWTEDGVDGIKESDAAGIALHATGPYDSVRLSDFATTRVRIPVAASDGVKLSDSSTTGILFVTDGIKLGDFAYVNVIGGCVTAVTITYTCVSDPSVTDEVSCVTPLVVPITEVG